MGSKCSGVYLTAVFLTWCWRRQVQLNANQLQMVRVAGQNASGQQTIVLQQPGQVRQIHGRSCTITETQIQTEESDIGTSTHTDTDTDAQLHTQTQSEIQTQTQSHRHGYRHRYRGRQTHRCTGTSGL